MWGGKRTGAGRRRLHSEIEQAALAAGSPIDKKAIDKGMATRILAKSNEREDWLELLKAPDLRLRFDVRKYLTDRRDGRPVQTINHLYDRPIDLHVQGRVDSGPALDLTKLSDAALWELEKLVESSVPDESV